MSDRQPRYVLSQRAADALRPLIEPGTQLESRPRPVHDALTSSIRLLRLRTRDHNGDTKIDVYLPLLLLPRVVYFGATSADPLSTGNTGTDLDHFWRDIGTLPRSGAWHVWLLARPPEFDVENGSTLIATPPKYSFAMSSTGNKPSDPDSKPCYGIKLGSWVPATHGRRYVECHTGVVVLPGTSWLQSTNALSLIGRDLSWYETIWGYDGLNVVKIHEQHKSETIPTT